MALYLLLRRIHVTYRVIRDGDGGLAQFVGLFSCCLVFSFVYTWYGWALYCLGATTIAWNLCLEKSA